jgi:capsular exopolysaccharide synthesis family protein
MKDNFPSRASAVISSLIDAYNEACIDNQNRSARNTTQFINDRLVVIEKELGGVENELKNYKEEHKITDISAVSQSYLTASSSYQDKSFEVNNQLSIARYIKEYLTSPANSRSLIPANSGLTNESINSQIKEYNDLLLKRDRLLGSSSVKNPVVSDINQSLDAMKAAINHSVDNLIATLQMQVDKLNSQESLIMSRIANTSGQELQLLSIERQQKVKEELYVYLLQKREENEIASLVNVGNTRIIMTPNGSASPVFPKSMNLLLVALMAGFLIPLGVLLAMNLLNTKVHSQSDLPSLQAPFLASIPLVGQPNSLLKRMRPRKKVHAPAHILVKQGSRDSLNEAFRVLRTNVDMMLGARKSVIMVTSYNPNAGKSFISLNTAAVMALKGKKVLLMDADLRKATLGKSLRSNENGYVSYLNGRKGSFTESVRSLAENLYFLPVGVLPPNPSELLLGDKFKGMLAELKKEFDYIIMDCPPIDIVADASILSPETDFTIFVIRAGLFDKRDVGMLNDMYNRKRFNEMAIILNGVDFSTVYHSYGHYGYGHYGYGNYSYGYGNEGSGNPGAQEDGKA